MKNLIYIAAATTFLFAACSSKNNDNTDTDELAAPDNEVSLTAEQAKNIDLKVAEISFGEISETLKLQGKIDVPPQNLVSISIPLGGYLKSTKMLPGTHVAKGQLIAVMEDPQYIQLQQDFLNAKNRLSYATKELARQKELNATKANSDKTLQLAETEFNSLRVEFNALVEKLKLININASKLTENNISRSVNIYSPINGYISKVNANIGKYVTPSDVIFELINPSDIHLSLTVFEKDINRIKVGQHVTAFTNTNPNVKFDTEVILVSHNVEAGGSSEVHCHFEKYDKSLVPGMYMNAELKVGNQKAQFLPEEAIVSFENKNFVFEELGERKFKMVEVEIGNTVNGATAILTNLAGKKLATKGAYSLLMKLKNTEEE